MQNHAYHTSVIADTCNIIEEREIFVKKRKIASLRGFEAGFNAIILLLRADITSVRIFTQTIKEASGAAGVRKSMW